MPKSIATCSRTICTTAKFITTNHSCKKIPFHTNSTATLPYSNMNKYMLTIRIYYAINTGIIPKITIPISCKNNSKLSKELLYINCR